MAEDASDDMASLKAFFRGRREIYSKLRADCVLARDSAKDPVTKALAIMASASASQHLSLWNYIEGLTEASVLLQKQLDRVVAILDKTTPSDELKQEIEALKKKLSSYEPAMATIQNVIASIDKDEKNHEKDLWRLYT